MKDLGYHYVSFRFDTKSALFSACVLQAKKTLSALIGAVLGEKRLDKV